MNSKKMLWGTLGGGGCMVGVSGCWTITASHCASSNKALLKTATLNFLIGRYGGEWGKRLMKAQKNMGSFACLFIFILK